MMRKIGFALIALVLSTGISAAADPIGEWLVADGFGRIKIDNCSGRLWGVVSWEKEPGGIDSNNPDPAKRGRPTLGIPILLGMKATEPNRWEGEIYNAENGKTYSGNISMVSPDVLRIQGCVLGFLCGGQDWTRVKTEAAAPKPGTRKDSRQASAAKSEVCSGIADSTGSAHERRLK